MNGRRVGRGTSYSLIPGANAGSKGLGQRRRPGHNGNQAGRAGTIYSFDLIYILVIVEYICRL